MAGETFEAQARQALANLRAVLEDAGSRMERVVEAIARFPISEPSRLTLPTIRPALGDGRTTGARGAE